MPKFTEAERCARTAVRLSFPGSRIYCRRDSVGYSARIDLANGSWCSTRGSSRAKAILNCLELACEPAPGFPGWVEPAGAAELLELALT